MNCGSALSVAWIIAFAAIYPIATAEEVCIAVGMDQKEAVALIQEHGGTDIGPGMEAVAPGGGPVVGVFWEFRDYDAVIELSIKDGKVARMGYWTKKDLGKGKLHEAESEQRIAALRLDTRNKAVAIDKAEPVKKPRP